MLCADCHVWNLHLRGKLESGLSTASCLYLYLSLYSQCLLPAYKLYSQIKEIVSNVKSENEQLVETIEALGIRWLVSRGCAIEIIFVVIGHSLLSNEMKCFCAMMSVHSITSNNINIWDRRTSERGHFANLHWVSIPTFCVQPMRIQLIMSTWLQYSKNVYLASLFERCYSNDRNDVWPPEQETNWQLCPGSGQIFV